MQLTILHFSPFATKAIALNPKFVEAYICRASAYDGLEQSQKAIEDLNQAILLDNSSIEAYNNRAGVFLTLRQYEKALDDCNKVINLAPENAVGYGMRGCVYFELGEYHKAIEDCNKAVDLDPNFVSGAYHWRGKSYEKLGESELAKGDFETAKKLGFNPDIIPEK